MNLTQIEAYKRVIVQYWQLLQELYGVVQLQIQLKPQDSSLYPTMIIGRTIAETVRINLQHNDEQFVLPPAAWVEPRKGTFKLRGKAWEYAFHSGGVSFFNGVDDISGEFTVSGQLGITAWTIKLYLETHSQDEKVIEHQDVLLKEMVKTGLLLAETPILIMDDQTFLLQGV